MSYRVTLGLQNEIALPDALCQELGIKIGDIMRFESQPDSSSLIVTKHTDQALTDDDIALAGDLARIFPLGPKHELDVIE
ncbi:hypothetical protein ACO1PK_01035 [Alishewanella sp. d11]|uniref:hypothetical protein n=1 Tax=Alishewanella sp. d11 TaxID=3414030 RepID=UPI003BF865EE